MARVKRVDNSRKDHTCGRGGHVIPAGDSYYTAAPGYRSSPKFRCLSHPFQPSELTTSLRSEPLAAIEQAQRDLSTADTFEDLESIREGVVDAMNTYRDSRQEALDAWENGNGQLEELLEQATEAADTAEGFSFESEEFEVDESEFNYEGETTDEPVEGTPVDQDDYDSELEAWTDERRAEWVSERRDELESMVSELSI